MTARQIMKSFALDLFAAAAGVTIIGLPMLFANAIGG